MGRARADGVRPGAAGAAAVPRRGGRREWASSSNSADDGRASSSNDDDAAATAAAAAADASDASSSEGDEAPSTPAKGGKSSSAAAGSPSSSSASSSSASKLKHANKKLRKRAKKEAGKARKATKKKSSGKSAASKEVAGTGATASDDDAEEEQEGEAAAAAAASASAAAARKKRASTVLTPPPGVSCEPRLDALPAEVALHVLAQVSPGRDWAALARTCRVLARTVEVAREVAFGVGDAGLLGEMYTAGAGYASQLGGLGLDDSSGAAAADGGAAFILGDPTAAPPWPAACVLPGVDSAAPPEDAVERVRAVSKRCALRRSALRKGFEVLADASSGAATTEAVPNVLSDWSEAGVFRPHAAVLQQGAGEAFANTTDPATELAPVLVHASMAHLLWRYIADPRRLVGGLGGDAGPAASGRSCAVPGRFSLSRGVLTAALTLRANAGVAESFLAMLDFVNLDLAEALCDALVYVSPSDVIDIAVLLEAFGKHYFSQNTTYHFASAKAVVNMAYAVLRLQYAEDTAAGGSSSSKSSSKRGASPSKSSGGGGGGSTAIHPKPLKALETVPLPLKRFVANARGVNEGGEALPPAYLEHLYNRVLVFGLHPSGSSASPGSSSSSSSSSSGGGGARAASVDVGGDGAAAGGSGSGAAAGAAATTGATTGRIYKTGWMQRQDTTGMLKRWRKRWFVMCDSRLLCFKEPKVGSGGWGVAARAPTVAGKDSNLTADLDLRAFTLCDAASGAEAGDSAAAATHHGHGSLQFSLVPAPAGGSAGAGAKGTSKGNHALAVQAESAAELAEWTALLRPVCADAEAARPSSVVGVGGGGGGAEAEKANNDAIPDDAPVVSPYFGSSVGDIVEREREAVEAELAAGRPAHRDVPLMLSRAFAWLRRPMWLDEEGLLRISGSRDQMVHLRRRMETSPDGALAVDFAAEKIDPHGVAGMVKQWLREVPEADRLFNSEQNEGMHVMVQYTAGMSAEEVAESLKPEVKDIIGTLTPAWRGAVLREVIDFLREVVAHSDKNKMGQDNVLRVMTPSLNCAPAFLSLPMRDFDYFFAPIAEAAADGDGAASAASGGKDESAGAGKGKGAAADKAGDDGGNDVTDDAAASAAADGSASSSSEKAQKKGGQRGTAGSKKDSKKTSSSSRKDDGDENKDAGSPGGSSEDAAGDTTADAGDADGSHDDDVDGGDGDDGKKSNGDGDGDDVGNQDAAAGKASSDKGDEAKASTDSLVSAGSRASTDAAAAATAAAAELSSADDDDPHSGAASDVEEAQTDATSTTTGKRRSKSRPVAQPQSAKRRSKSARVESTELAKPPADVAAASSDPKDGDGSAKAGDDAADAGGDAAETAAADGEAASTGESRSRSKTKSRSKAGKGSKANKAEAAEGGDAAAAADAEPKASRARSRTSKRSKSSRKD